MVCDTSVAQNQRRRGCALLCLATLSIVQPRAASAQWLEGHPPLPEKVSEASAAMVGDSMYVFGGSSPATHVYTFDAADPTLPGTWSTRKERPIDGDHHAVVTYKRGIFIFGALSGAGGKVQRYDVDDDSWSVSDIPWSAGGSLCTAARGKFAFVCGGITGGRTITTCGRLNMKTMKWMPMQDMPIGVNHAAAGTDGQKFYVFGGRDGGNSLGPGFDYTQVYDPENDTWNTSFGLDEVLPYQGVSPPSMRALGFRPSSNIALSCPCLTPRYSRLAPLRRLQVAVRCLQPLYRDGVAWAPLRLSTASYLSLAAKPTLKGTSVRPKACTRSPLRTTQRPTRGATQPRFPLGCMASGPLPTRAPS